MSCMCLKCGLVVEELFCPLCGRQTALKEAKGLIK